MARGTRRAFPTTARNDVAQVLADEYNLKLLAELDGIRNALSGDSVRTPAGLAIGSTDDQIASAAFTFNIAGVPETKAAVAAGTAPGAQTVTADMWALYILSIAAGGTITVTPAAANVAGYATEALAIAAIPSTPANQALMGYVTVQTAAGLAWIAATDAFAGGAAGNPALTTNYYDDAGVIVEANGARTLRMSR
jgi:hypothetical protein